VTRRTTWLIDMGDGTWAVCCTACRMALYRGPKTGDTDRPSSRPTLGPGAAARPRTPPVDGRAAHRQPPLASRSSS